MTRDPADEAVAIEAAVEALTYVREYLRDIAQPQPQYGMFIGGDPRDFSPDPECSTEEERAAHKRDCEAWNRGERSHSVKFGHEHFTGNPPPLDPSAVSALVVRGVGGHVTHAGYGLGVTHMQDPDACEALERVESALDKIREATR